MALYLIFKIQGGVSFVSYLRYFFNVSSPTLGQWIYHCRRVREIPHSLTHSKGTRHVRIVREHSWNFRGPNDPLTSFMIKLEKRSNNNFIPSLFHVFMSSISILFFTFNRHYYITRRIWRPHNLGRRGRA